VGLLLGVAILLPGQGLVDPGLEYGYVCSSEKSESIDFTLAAARPESYFLFGSSELVTRPEVVVSAPSNVFRDYDCGMQFMFIGDSYDQSLWMAIAAGAYAQDMPNNKIAIIVSLQWFFDGGLEPGLFNMRFSYNLYRAFCENENISRETKDYVAGRLAAEGIDRAILDAADPKLPQDYLNALAFSAMSDMRLRQSLIELRQYGSERVGPSLGEPDFALLRQQAIASAQRMSTNNEWGILDDYWAYYLEPLFEARKGELSGETLSRTPEFEDFLCFLEVCEQAGLEPYVVFMPVNGYWYDHAGLSADTRAALYGHLGEICEQRAVSYLDLSVHEYELYYMRDIMHLGWLGWLEVEEGFMAFVREEL